MDTNQQQMQEGAPSGQYVSAPRAGKPGRNRKHALVIGGVIMLLLVAVAGAYMLFLRSKTPAKKTSAPVGVQKEKTPVMSEGQASTPKAYKSTKLNIEFTYRNDWTVRESSDKSEVIVTSPRITYQKKEGASTEGVFTVKMRNGLVPDAMKSTIENAVAVKDSEVIAYAQPSDQQRQYTNLSFAGNATNTNFFMVTGSIAFKTGETFGSNVDLQGSVYLFAGGYGTDPNDALVFDAVPKGSFETATYRQAVDIIKSLKIY